MAEKQRMNHVDVARGIAMICIIVGHLGIWEVVKVVFPFHVPIFFLITGYFFKMEDSWGAFLKKKAKTLLLPYGVASLIMAVLAAVNDRFLFQGQAPFQIFWNWIKAALYGAGDTTPRLFDVYQIGALWFLLATWWGLIFLRVSLQVPYPFRWIPLAAFFAAGYFTHDLWYPFSIQAGSTALLFMYIGYQIRIIRNQGLRLSPEGSTGLFILAVLVWYWFSTNFQSFNLVHADLGRGAIDVAASLLVCYAVLMISWFLDRHVSVVAKPLAYLGKYSILMLCMHIIELNIFPWWMVMDRLHAMGMSGAWDTYALIGMKFLWIIPMVVICEKCGPLRILFGLGRKKRA